MLPHSDGRAGVADPDIETEVGDEKQIDISGPPMRLF
jgi:hypothetical protein